MTVSFTQVAFAGSDCEFEWIDNTSREKIHTLYVTVKSNNRLKVADYSESAVLDVGERVLNPGQRRFGGRLDTDPQIPNAYQKYGDDGILYLIKENCTEVIFEDDLNWTSSNPDVVKVDGRYIESVSYGTAKLTAHPYAKN